MSRYPWSPRYTPVLLIPLVYALAGCSANTASYDDDAYYPGDSEASPAPGAGEPVPTLPPESGDAFYRAAPAASDKFVYVVNPDRDTLSKINAATRAVYTLTVGTHPTQVEIGSKDPSKALVLNEGSSTVSIVTTATDAIQTLPIHKDTNFMKISADAQYAITYYNANVEGSSSDVEGARSYSNISVVFTGDGSQAPTSTSIAVALNPRDAAFVPSTSQALVLCDNALAQVTLSPAPTARLIALSDDVDEELQVAELKVSPDGHYAFLRLANLPDLLVVDLTASDPGAAVTRLALAAVPSDMDLSGNALVLVDRTNQTLEVFQALDPSAPSTSIPTPANQIVGSILMAPEAGKAILYTTLTANDIKGTPQADVPLNRFSVWDLNSDKITVHELVKAVQAVSINHNAGLEVATFIHDGDAASDVEAFDHKNAFSNYYFSDGLAVPTVLEAPIKALADTPDNSHEFLILEDSLYVVVVDYQSRQVDALAVQSQPAFVGILTGTETGYVSQEHDLGRISFIDPSSMAVSTITGFELNSQP